MAPRRQDPAPPPVPVRSQAGGRTVPTGEPTGPTDQFQVQVEYAPIAVLDFDLDDGSLAGQPLTDVTGDGVFVTAGLAGETGSAGVRVGQFDLDADGVPVLLRTFGFEVSHRTAIDANGVFSAEIGGGAGIADVDVELPGVRRTQRALGQLRFGFRIEPTASLSFVLGGGVTVIGEPGDTYADGTFLLVGAAIRF